MSTPQHPGKEVPPPTSPPVPESGTPSRERQTRPGAGRLALPVAAPKPARPTSTRTTTELRTPAPEAVDAKALAAALERKVRGEVRFDAGSRALYSTDGSNYRQVPIGVVIPHDADDLEIGRAHV